MPLNRSVESFEDGPLYETTIYGKGALFYSKLRQVLGDRRFQHFLREYLAQHRYQIVDTKTWHESLEKLQLPELEALFEDWVGGVKPVLPTPVPNELEDEGTENGGTENGGTENGGTENDAEEEVPDTL